MVTDPNAYGGGAEGSGNYGDVSATDPCAQANVDLAAARDLCQKQILQWRSEKPPRTWAWINKQPAAQAYYGPLHGK